MTADDKTNLRYTGDYSRKLMTDSELMTETYEKIKKAEMVCCLYNISTIEFFTSCFYSISIVSRKRDLWE